MVVSLILLGRLERERCGLKVGRLRSLTWEERLWGVQLSIIGAFEGVGVIEPKSREISVNLREL